MFGDLVEVGEQESSGDTQEPRDSTKILQRVKEGQEFNILAGQQGGLPSETGQETRQALWRSTEAFFQHKQQGNQGKNSF